MEIEIKDLNQFQAEVSSGKVLVDFYASWCGPCQMLSPLVKQLGEEHPEIKVLKVDVDEVPELASRFGISSIPFLVYFENGNNLRNNLGYIGLDELESFVGIKK